MHNKIFKSSNLYKLHRKRSLEALKTQVHVNHNDLQQYALFE